MPEVKRTLLRDIVQQRRWSFGATCTNSSAIHSGHFPLSYSHSLLQENKTAGCKLELKEEINVSAPWFTLVAVAISV